jgi:hypothetical protein
MRECGYDRWAARAANQQVTLSADGGLASLDRLRRSLGAPEVRDQLSVSLNAWTEDEHLKAVRTGFE